MGEIYIEAKHPDRCLIDGYEQPKDIKRRKTLKWGTLEGLVMSPWNPYTQWQVPDSRPSPGQGFSWIRLRRNIKLPPRGRCSPSIGTRFHHPALWSSDSHPQTYKAPAAWTSLRWPVPTNSWNEWLECSWHDTNEEKTYALPFGPVMWGSRTLPQMRTTEYRPMQAGTGDRDGRLSWADLPRWHQYVRLLTCIPTTYLLQDRPLVSSHFPDLWLCVGYSSAYGSKASFLADDRKCIMLIRVECFRRSSTVWSSPQVRQPIRWM